MFYGISTKLLFVQGISEHFNNKMIIPIGCILVMIISGIFKKLTKKAKTLNGRHVLVTGGSSGIGKAIAVLAVKQGAHVTIAARDLTKLKDAEIELKAAAVSDIQQIRSISLDVTNYNHVEESLQKLDRELPIYMLVNCAGLSICRKIEDISIEDVNKLLNVNFYGTYFPIKAIVTKMKERQDGHIVIVGSQASLLGIFGFTAYSASKYALRGLAEALDMEVSPYGITVTISLPPDTDTPGFETENLTKLEETKLISESAGLFKPEDVAKKTLKDALAGRFLSSIGFESFILTTLCVGMTRFSSILDVLVEIIFLALFRVVSLLYLSSFYKTIKQVADKNRTIEKKAK